jgi:hypothetical protein
LLALGSFSTSELSKGFNSEVSLLSSKFASDLLIPSSVVSYLSSVLMYSIYSATVWPLQQPKKKHAPMTP